MACPGISRPETGLARPAAPGRVPSACVLTILWLVLLVPAGSVAGTATDCTAAEDSIAALKGHDGAAAETGRPAEVAGIVTGEFLGGDALNGFYLQEPVPEGLPSGLFVYAPGLDQETAAGIAPGTAVRVRGRFTRFRGQFQLHRLEAVEVCGEPGLPEPVAISLPWSHLERERYEGLLVTFPGRLTVTGNYELDRYGVLSLAAEGRLFRPTHRPPARPEHNRARRIELDDGSYRSQPEPIPYLDEDGSRRVGSEVSGLTGILAYAFDEYRIHPTEAVTFQNANARPEALDLPAAGHIRVAAFNVENYFVNPDGRGAQSRVALERQRAKLTRALLGLRADLIILNEVENDADAVADLVKQVNGAAPGQDLYRAVQGPADPGDDDIRTAMIYRPDRLAALGPAVSDPDPVHDRPPVAAAFRALEGDMRLGVVGVHLKSKADCPAEGDVDRGQGCWNRLRVEQARAITEALASREMWPDTDKWLILGDLNAYGSEDPAQLLEQAGYMDLLAEHVPEEERYTYVYRGESGYLDHAWANEAAARHVFGVRPWPINADEPAFLAYDRPRAGPGPYRSSDHDPVVVDLRVTKAYD